MAILGIQDFKSKLVDGGARANLFECKILAPPVMGGNGQNSLAFDPETTSFMIRAASMPGSTLGLIEVPFRGRKLKLAGDRSFEPWTITVLNDTRMPIRNWFESWMGMISANALNIGVTNPSQYMSDMMVSQLNRNGDITKTYRLIDAWPKSISNIELNAETSDQIQTFTVEMEYQYWLPDLNGQYE